MKKLISLISKNVDKVLHILCAYIIVVSSGIYFINIVLGIVFGLIASILKEGYDQYSYNGWSWGDLGADAIGIILAVIFLFIVI